MSKFTLNKPDLSKISEIRINFLEKNFFKIYFNNNLNKFSDKKFYYWDKIRFQKIPHELESHEELWFVIKRFRKYWKMTMVNTEDWNFFKIWNLDFLNQLLHKLDLWLWWNFLWINFNDKDRKILLQNWSEDEAISSSQIEWAMTASKVAKDMILKGRKPISKDEKMILNNYNAMKFVNDESEDWFKNKVLTEELLLELQNILTKDTLENKDEEWRFRKDSDDIVISNPLDWVVYHTPPGESFLKSELKNFIKYANDEDWEFIHPFIKATVLHFWIWYFHPFCDWNWRTARLIFYWYLLKKWYWWFSYIPISTSIKKSKWKYEKAYIYSEQDDFDLTYFLVYMANKTQESFDDFKEYIKNKRDKQKKDFSELSSLALNDREKKLISYFLENWKGYTNNSIHKNYYWIARETSKRDLENLLKKWFLRKEKQWLYVNYFPVENLKDLI